MKKYIFSYFLFFFGISQLLLSQKNLDSLTAAKTWQFPYYKGFTFVKKNGKCAAFCADTLSIPFLYDTIIPMGSNISPIVFKVFINKKGGIVDERNTIIVPLQYDNIDLFWDNKMPYKVVKDEKIGYLYENKNVIYPNDLINQTPKFELQDVSETDLLFHVVAADSKFYRDKPRLHGFINKKSQWVIPPIYTAAKAFEEGLAPVQVKDKWGYINHKNKLVIANQYTDAGCFKDGFAMVKNDSVFNSKPIYIYHFINHKGKRVSSFYYKNGDNRSFRKNRFYLDFSYHNPQLIIKNKTVTIDSIVINEDEHPFQDGLQAFWVNGKWGFRDANKRVIIAPQFYDVTDFSDGGAAFYEKETWAIGIINKQGKIIMPPQFIANSDENLYEFRDSLMVVQKGNKFGVIGTKGDFIIPLKWFYLEYLKNGFFLFRDSINRAGLITMKNDIIIDSIDKLFSFEIRDSMIILRNGSYGKNHLLYNYSGNLLSTEKNDRIFFLHNGWAYNRGNKMLINQKGEHKYYNQRDSIYGDWGISGFASEGLLKIYRNDNGERGYINEEGRIVVPPQYNMIGDFNNGLAYIEKDGFYGYINKKNEIIIPCVFDYVGDFKDGFAPVSIRDFNRPYYSIINTKGEILLPFMLGHLAKFNNQIIDEKGRVVRE